MTTEGRVRAIESLRIAGSLGALALFGILATGCGLRGNNANVRTEPYQVRVWRIDQDVDPIKSTMERFESDNEGKVDVTYTKKSFNGYELSSLKSLAARTGPDVWSIPNDWLGDHVVRIQGLPDGFFQTGEEDDTTPANNVEAVKAVYPEGIADQLITTDGKTVLGAPTNVDVLHLYYNSALFSDATTEFRKSLGDDLEDSVYQPVRQLLSNPPTTWSALVDQTRYLTKKNGTEITRSAVAMGTADNAPESEDLVQLLMLQNGTRVVSTDRTRAMFHIAQSAPAGGTVRPGENALDFFASFSNPSKPNYTWNPSMPQALDAFAQGKVAMVIAYSDFGKQLEVKYPRFRFQTAPVPQISAEQVQPSVNLIKFTVETVTKTADSYEASWKFVRRYTAYELASTVAEERDLTTPYLAELKRRSDSFPQKQILTGQTVFKKQREQFDSTFRQLIMDVSQNGIASSQALDTAAEKINGLLASTDE